MVLEEPKGAPEVELGLEESGSRCSGGRTRQSAETCGQSVLKSQLMIKSHSKKEYGRQQVIIGYNCFSLTYPETLYD